MASPKANAGDSVNMLGGEEAYDALSAPTYQGRGNTSKTKEPNPAHNARPRKHLFDRHDGTGRGHETEKKHGAGAANWGTEGAEQAEDLELSVQASLAREAELAAAGPEFVAAADVEGEADALTLDEYEARRHLQGQEKGRAE